MDNTEPLLQDKRRLNGKLQVLSTEQKELVRALGKKTMPVELIEERVQEIEREKTPILKQMDEIESKLDNQDWQKIDMEMVFGNLLRFNEVFDEMEFEEKRIFLRSIVKEIIYDKGHIKILLYFLPEIIEPNIPSGHKNNSDTSVMNGCLCGNFGSDLECRCTPMQIHKYLGRISGPLLDRMDLHVEVPRIKNIGVWIGNTGKIYKGLSWNKCNDTFIPRQALSIYNNAHLCFMSFCRKLILIGECIIN